MSKRSIKNTRYVARRTYRPRRNTNTGYSGGRLYNSMQVTQPKPYAYGTSLTVPIEWQTTFTIDEYSSGDFTYKTIGGTIQPGTVTKLDIKEESKQTIWNQLQAFAGMIKAIYLKSMTIEFISVTDKSTTVGANFFLKTKYQTSAPSAQEMMCVQPIALFVAGQSRTLKPNIPKLNQQIVAAPNLEATDFANKWTAIPSDFADLDLAIPNLFILLNDAFSVANEDYIGKVAYYINVKFNIGIMRSDALAELTRPNIFSRAWKGVRKIASNGVVRAVAKSAVKAALGA